MPKSYIGKLGAIAVIVLALVLSGCGGKKGSGSGYGGALGHPGAANNGQVITS